MNMQEMSAREEARREPMTDERLAEIEARANAATPGPWRYTLYFVMSPSQGLIADIGPGSASVNSDAAFIAHARTDVPALLAEVRRLREEIVSLRENQEPSSSMLWIYRRPV